MQNALGAECAVRARGVRAHAQEENGKGPAEDHDIPRSAGARVRKMSASSKCCGARHAHGDEYCSNNACLQNSMHALVLRAGWCAVVAKRARARSPNVKR